MAHSEGEAVSCFSSFMPAQDWPGTQGLFRDKEKWENRDERGNRELLREKEASKRRERGETQRQSQRQRRGSWLRGVCVLFLVSLMHISNSTQLLEHLHTHKKQKLQHTSCTSTQQEDSNFRLAQVFQLLLA